MSDDTVPPEAEALLYEFGALTRIEDFRSQLGPADEVMDAPKDLSDSGGQIVRWHIYRKRWPTIVVTVTEYTTGGAAISAALRTS